MIGMDVVGLWDTRARQLEQDSTASDKSVYEFDLTLWTLLHTLARERPEEALARFAVDAHTVARMASATPAQLERLASGVLFSFRSAGSDQEILTRLTENYDRLVFLNQQVDAFTSAYWFLIKRVAARGIEVASEVFGISQELCRHIATASDNQIRHMAVTIDTRIALRFDAAILDDLLDESPRGECSPVATLKKLQQSLSWSGRKKGGKKR